MIVYTAMLSYDIAGSGILNQPYVVQQSGLVGAYIGYAFATLITWRSVNFLTDAGTKKGGIYMTDYIDKC